MPEVRRNGKGLQSLRTLPSNVLLKSECLRALVEDPYIHGRVAIPKDVLINHICHKSQGNATLNEVLKSSLGQTFPEGLETGALVFGGLRLT
jgi:hypothetical protein